MENLYEIPTVNFDAVLESERNEHEPKQYYKKENTFDKKNYLNTKLKKDEKEKTLIIRILPNPKEKNNNPFIHIHSHKVQHLPKEVSESGYKTYFCLGKYNDSTDRIDHEKFGDKCPFCEIREQAYKDSLEVKDDEIKKKDLQKLSVSNIPIDSVIMRVIERGHEEDGPKFWKVNVSKRADDPYSLILKLYNNLKAFGDSIGETENIFDTLNGRDLIVTISKSDNADDKKTTTTITQAPNKSPLSKDENKMREWIFDKKQWSDVFAVKTYDYLSIISGGKQPWFDNMKGKWVDKDEYDKEKKEEEEKKQKETQLKAEKINAEIEATTKELGKMFINEDEEETF